MMICKRKTESHTRCDEWVKKTEGEESRAGWRWGKEMPQRVQVIRIMNET